jgi:hypothetical protein
MRSRRFVLPVLRIHAMNATAVTAQNCRFFFSVANSRETKIEVIAK